MGEVDFGCNQLRCFNLVPMPWGGGWVGCTSTGACYGCAPLCIARCERRGFGGGALLDVSGGIGQGGSGSMFRVSVVVGPSRPVSGEWWVALERVTDVRRCARCDLGGEHRSMSGGNVGVGGLGHWNNKHNVRSRMTRSVPWSISQRMAGGKTDIQRLRNANAPPSMLWVACGGEGTQEGLLGGSFLGFIFGDMCKAGSISHIGGIGGIARCERRDWGGCD